MKMTGSLAVQGMAVLLTGIKALLLAATLSAPLVAAGAVHAESDSIIESSYRAASGAGFVLMVSLQRAR